MHEGAGSNFTVNLTLVCFYLFIVTEQAALSAD